MSISSCRRAVATFAAAAATTCSFLAAPTAAVATGISAPGTIVYDLAGDIYLTTPTGSAQVRVTHDGGTVTADGTGDTGYFAPSESDGGLVVAVRNQQFNKGQPSEYTQGYLWEMDRSGHPIRKFKPDQWTYIPGGGCTVNVEELPLGIINAVVSPDGKYIAYTATTYVQSPAPNCQTAQGYSTWIVNADGTNARMVRDTSNSTASLEVGQWLADSSALLVDRADFGSIADFYVPAGTATAHLWTYPPAGNYTDSAFGQPDVRNGVLATDGYSGGSDARVVRLWAYNGLAAGPTFKCEILSDVDAANIDEALSRPSLAPDGSVVAFEDANGAPDQANEGIYLISTSVMNTCGAGDQTLFIPHGADPFWTPAGLYGPPTVSFTEQPAALSASRTATVQFTATTPDPARHIVGYTCKLDSAPAQTCTSPQSLSGLADGAHTFTVVASDGAQTGSAAISWQVDATRPTVSMTAPRSVWTASPGVRVTWTGSDAGSGIARYQVRYRQAAYSGGFSAWRFPGAWQQLTGTSLTATGLRPGYDYCYSVRAVDKAGNASPWTGARCIARPLDDRSLVAAGGWTRITGSAYYLSTASTSSRMNATLTRTNANVVRIGVLGETCPTCGTVGVYLGSTLIGKVGFRSTTTHYRVMRLLPTFAFRSGTVTLKVLTSGEPVTVDGLLLSRT